MFQKLQKYLEEGNFKLFFKYDGERDKNQYSIVFITKNNVQDVVSIDTDEPLKTFFRILDEKKIEIDNNETNELIEKFYNMKQQCIDYFGKKVIFIFTIEVKGSMQFYISITKERENWKITSCYMSEIELYIKNRGEENICSMAKIILQENRETFEELAK